MVYNRATADRKGKAVRKKGQGETWFRSFKLALCILLYASNDKPDSLIALAHVPTVRRLEGIQQRCRGGVYQPRPSAFSPFRSVKAEGNQYTRKHL